MLQWHQCGRCPFRAYAEKRPETLVARVWRWHTGWCPGWKAYQKAQAAGNGAAPKD